MGVKSDGIIRMRKLQVQTGNLRVVIYWTQNRLATNLLGIKSGILLVLSIPWKVNYQKNLAVIFLKLLLKGSVVMTEIYTNTFLVRIAKKTNQWKGAICLPINIISDCPIIKMMFHKYIHILMTKLY